MRQPTDEQILETLQEIRDGQREVLAALAAQRAIAEEQLQKSRQAVAESIDLQRQALARQRSITLIAVPGIVACIAAIGYLILRYF